MTAYLLTDKYCQFECHFAEKYLITKYEHSISVLNKSYEWNHLTNGDKRKLGIKKLNLKRVINPSHIFKMQLSLKCFNYCYYCFIAAIKLPFFSRNKEDNYKN